MSSSYDDLASPADMLEDCRATGAHLGLAVPRSGEAALERAARRASRPAPSLYFDEQPGERAKREIEVSAAAARLAGALHFHLE